MDMQHRMSINMDDADMPLEESKAFIESLGICKGKRVLEIGNGTGLFTLYCAVNGCETTSFCEDPSVVQILKKNAEKHGVDITFKDSCLFEAAGGEYDVIVFNFARLDGLGPLPELIDQAPIYMKKDGRIIIVTSASVNQKKITDLFSDFIIEKKGEIQTPSGTSRILEVIL